MSDLFDDMGPVKPVGRKWGWSISSGRMARLQRLYAAWEVRAAAGPAEDDGPYKGKRLSGADAFWVLVNHWHRGSGEPLDRCRSRLRSAQPGDRELEELEQKVGVANLNGANLARANMTGAWLRGASLKGAVLDYAQLSNAQLTDAIFNRASLKGTVLHVAMLRGASFRGAILIYSHLEFAYLDDVDFSSAWLINTHLEGVRATEARFINSCLAGSRLNGANLESADLRGANLERPFWAYRPLPTDLGAGRVQAGCLYAINKLAAVDKMSAPEALGPANLSRVRFNSETVLANVIIGDSDGIIALGDARYDEVDLTRINWPKGPLNDEVRNPGGRSPTLRFDELHQIFASAKPRPWWKLSAKERQERRQRRVERPILAGRANRQLAAALRGQGMTEPADYFAYRGYRCRQRELWLRQRYLSWLGWSVVRVLAGYGYRPLNAFICYGATVLGFAVAYFFVNRPSARQAGMNWWQALTYSVIALHGRGLSPVALGGATEALSAVEAVIGLLIEAVFVAVLIQRVFIR